MIAGLLPAMAIYLTPPPAPPAPEPKTLECTWTDQKDRPGTTVFQIDEAKGTVVQGTTAPLRYNARFGTEVIEFGDLRSGLTRINRLDLSFFYYSSGWGILSKGQCKLTQKPKTLI